MGPRWYSVCFLSDHRAHRPRWTALGELTVCIGSILFVIPHFATDEYIPKRNQLDNYLCEPGRNDSRTCEESGASSGGDDLSGYLALFILARIVMGLGAEPLFTHAVTYLDDIVTKQDFSLYIGKRSMQYNKTHNVTCSLKKNTPYNWNNNVILMRNSNTMQHYCFPII